MLRRMTEGPKPKTAAKKPPPPEPKRRRRLHPLGLAVAAVTRPLVGRKGFAEVDILSQWTAIVGPEIAAQTLPMKVVKARAGEPEGGTLHVRVGSAAFATVLKHEEPRVCDRINGYFGFAAVTKIRATIGRIPVLTVKPPPPPPPPLSAAEKEVVDGVADPDLRAALERLGRAVHRAASGKG